MAQFEKYHPILTAHFQLDWLTQFRVNAINAQRNASGHSESMLATADFVNRQMSEIMKDNALVWGIGDRNTDDFLGVFGFQAIDQKNGTANVVLELTDVAPVDLIFNELVTHMLAFADEELGLSQLTVKQVTHEGMWQVAGFKSTGDQQGLTCEV